MKWSSGSAVVAAALLAMLPSCRKKPAERVAADLGEAGYKLTTEDFFRASRTDDAAALKKFSAGKFPLDTRDAEGNTALHAAAAAGALATADYLLDHGLSIDITGKDGRTPLMAAVIENQTAMAKWLLRQGANPHLKDKDGFKPLMLATREGSKGSVAELAAHDREDLDAALLMAALVGRVDIIDSLTNYGASVYARMDDGRTPLMIAAENGNEGAVKLLLEIGASRLTTELEGHTAAELADAAGHRDIAALIRRDPVQGELALESPEQVAAAMDAAVDGALAKADRADKAEAGEGGAGGASPGESNGGGNKNVLTKNDTSRSRERSIPLGGAVLSAPVPVTAEEKGSVKSGAAGNGPAGNGSFPMPPLVMRYYREREVPVSVRTVKGDAATILIPGGKTTREATVRPGETIPGTSLTVVRVQRRMEDSKVNLGKPSEISVVEIRDRSTGVSREWISGIPSVGHDPAALVEDAATGKRYIASPGQTFTGADGATYQVSDVRPNQMVIRDTATGAARTIPLRGPRG